MTETSIPGPDAGPRRPPHAAVFGSSEPRPGDALYDQARRVGRALAEAGWGVLTGGYGGVMEGASRGAADAGGRALGVTCRIFDSRAPNRWLTDRVETADLHERTARLIDGADGFVVLGGKAGTLAEVAQLWALMRAGCLGTRRVVLLGAQWERLLPHLRELEVLESQQLEATRLVVRPEDVVGALGPLPGGGLR